MDNTEKTESKFTDKEKQDFFKAFLTDKPFESEASLFNGQLKVVFKSLTVQESIDVFDQLKADQEGSILTNDATYSIKLTNYRLAASLVSINDVPFFPAVTKAKQKAKDASESYIKAKAASLDGWPVFKLAAFAEAFKEFEDKVVALTGEVSDPNFWTAVPLS